MQIRGNFTVANLQQQATYLQDTGSADIYVVSFLPSIIGYTNGLQVVFKATETNTGPSTLNVDGFGAIPLVKDVSFPLGAGDILAGQIITATYDGTNFQIFSDGTSFFPCGLFQGGIVTWDSGLIFDISPADYKLCCEEGVRHSGQTQVTLSPADGTNPRFDAIILGVSGVDVIEGTPSSNPDFPQPADCQILLTYIYIPAGSLVPGDGGCGTPSQTVIYDETGGTEWTPATVGVTINFNDATTPYHLTKDGNAGAFSAAQSFNFTKGSGTINLADYTALKFYLRLKSTFHPQAKFGIFFQNTLTVQPSASAIMQTGQYGYDRTTVGTYQIITIPMSVFLAGNTATANKLYFLFLNQGNANGFYIDWIQLQGGICQPPNTGGQSGYSGVSGYSAYSGKSGYSGYSAQSGYSGYSATGNSGYSGYSSPGASGYSGFSAISGYSGYSSQSGYSGYSAISGYSGYSSPGTSGYSGYSGLDGTASASGYSGYSSIGSSGYSGYSAVSGYSGYSSTSGFSGYSSTSGFSGYSSTGNSGYSGYSAGGPFAVHINELLLAIGTNNIDNANYNQTWTWNTLAGTTALKLSSTSTAAASNTQKLFEISLSGANGNANQITYAAYFSNTHTGTNAQNRAIYGETSGPSSVTAYLTSTNGIGLYSNSTGGSYAIEGQADVGTGVYGHSDNGGIGISSQSVNGISLSANSIMTSTSTVVTVFQMTRSTTGTAGNGIGGSIDFNLEADNGNSFISNQLISKFTTAANASRVSELSFTGVNAAVTATLAVLSGSGAFKLNKYGINTFGDTPDYALGVKADGSVVEFAVGGGSDTNFAITDLTFTGNRTHDLDGNDLTIKNAGPTGNFLFIIGDETFSGAYSEINTTKDYTFIDSQNGSGDSAVLSVGMYPSVPRVAMRTEDGTNDSSFEISTTGGMKLYTNKYIVIDSGLTDAVDDAAAATAGVPLKALYRNGSVMMIRVA